MQYTVAETFETLWSQGSICSMDHQSSAAKILRGFDTPSRAERRRKRFINEISKLEMIIRLGIAGVKMSIYRSDFYSMFDHMFDQTKKATSRAAVSV